MEDHHKKTKALSVEAGKVHILDQRETQWEELVPSQLKAHNLLHCAMSISHFYKSQISPFCERKWLCLQLTFVELKIIVYKVIVL